MNYTDVTVARPSYGASVGERWNPWRALRARPEVTFARRNLPEGIRGACVVWPDETVILVDYSLGRRERRVVLAHELIHVERGVGTDQPGMPSTWAPVVAKEEAAVNAEVARRLVPLDELEEWVRRRTESDITTTPFDVSVEWDTTEQLAELAMLLMDPGGTQ